MAVVFVDCLGPYNNQALRCLKYMDTLEREDSRAFVRATMCAHDLSELPIKSWQTARIISASRRYHLGELHT